VRFSGESMTTSSNLPRVAVITPYYQETMEVLRKCHESVLGQTHPCVHFLVADGSPHTAVRNWSAEHIVLPRPHADNGNTPRGVGSLSAMKQGFDAIAYLDADNWYYPTHVESMVNLRMQKQVVVCTATRNIHRLDGSLMYTDNFESDGHNHVDTSCLFLTQTAFGILPLWIMMPSQLGPLCDRVIWQAIVARGLSHAQNPEPTVAFRTQYQVHYQYIKESPPPGTKTNAESTGQGARWWQSQPADVRKKWMRYFETPLP
jgi:glycosyltransferase involved in cell wall biosynthesis